MTDVDLEQWVREANAGSRQALERTLDVIQGKVYGLCVRMLWHPEDAQDATQEVLIRVMTLLGNFRGERAFIVVKGQFRKLFFNEAQRTFGSSRARQRYQCNASCGPIAEFVAPFTGYGLVLFYARDRPRGTAADRLKFRSSDRRPHRAKNVNKIDSSASCGERKQAPRIRVNYRKHSQVMELV